VPSSMSMETRLQKLERLLAAMTGGPTYADLLRAAVGRAQERLRLGLPRDDTIPPETDDPLMQPYRQAKIWAAEARRRVQRGDTTPS